MIDKIKWLISLIPFLNRYPIWAQIVILLCLFIVLSILVFAYPKHSQSSNAQVNKIYKSTEIEEVKGDYVAGDKVAGDKVVYNKYEDKKDNTSKKISLLSIEDIEETIEKFPPAQRDDARNNFKGIKVEWDLYLFNARKERNNIIRLTLGTEKRGFPFVICNVSLKEYPELAVLPKDTKIKIRGEIEKVDGLDIELTNVELFFLKENSS